MSDWKGDLIGFLLFIFLFFLHAYLILEIKQDTQNDNRNNPPAISNNNGLRGASRCSENNF